MNIIQYKFHIKICAITVSGYIIFDPLTHFHMPVSIFQYMYLCICPSVCFSERENEKLKYVNLHRQHFCHEGHVFCYRLLISFFSDSLYPHFNFKTNFGNPRNMLLSCLLFFMAAAAASPLKHHGRNLFSWKRNTCLFFFSLSLTPVYFLFQFEILQISHFLQQYNFLKEKSSPTTIIEKYELA